MSDAHRDNLRDRIETAKEWLKCEECDPDFKENPFDCEFVANCLYDKCEEMCKI